jgi:hypothetical protein
VRREWLKKGAEAIDDTLLTIGLSTGKDVKASVRDDRPPRGTTGGNGWHSLSLPENQTARLSARLHPARGDLNAAHVTRIRCGEWQMQMAARTPSPGRVVKAADLRDRHNRSSSTSASKRLPEMCLSM